MIAQWYANAAHASARLHHASAPPRHPANPAHVRAPGSRMEGWLLLLSTRAQQQRDRPYQHASAHPAGCWRAQADPELCAWQQAPSYS